MEDRYDYAWDDLKRWLDGQQEYIMLPVKMVKYMMHELEDTYHLGE